MDPTDNAAFFQLPQHMNRSTGPRPLLRFYTEAVELPGKSATEGRPIYENRDFVAITNPGSRDEVVRYAKDKAKQDPYVAHAYKIWKDTQEQPCEGTPLEQVPFLNPAQVKELKALNIPSLEALADLSDTAKQRFNGGHELQRKAKALLEAAKGSAYATRLETELAKRDDEIKFLRDQIAQINARYEAEKHERAA